jgi:hypothetical protein
MVYVNFHHPSFKSHAEGKNCPAQQSEIKTSRLQTTVFINAGKE